MTHTPTPSPNPLDVARRRRTLPPCTDEAALTAAVEANDGRPIDLFPDGEDGRAPADAPARRLCDACPVRQECLEYAVTASVHDGIWGGRDPHERRALAKQRGIVEHGKLATYNHLGCRCVRCREAMRIYQADRHTPIDSRVLESGRRRRTRRSTEVVG